MAMFRLCTSILAALLALIPTSTAQQVSPSNNTSEIPPYQSSPRFWVNGSTFDGFRVIPLGWYAQIPQQNFLSASIDGRLVHVDSTNANEFTSDAIDYISCDPEDYVGVLNANNVLQMVLSAQQGNSIVLYSTRANHCDAANFRSIQLNGLFSTLDPVLAARVENQVKNATNGMSAIIRPDTQSFTVANNSNPAGGNFSPQAQPGPTTAVAMIILYTITGMITALFIIIIVTGAIRAHRHPDRYGPSNVAGRPRRSRAKGIARAMLDTIPIVKFGEKVETPSKEVDVEMSSPAQSTAVDTSGTTSEVTSVDKVSPPVAAATSSNNPDGTDEHGQLGCSICTEDFNKGEEVRVLPCNHKFHPECVDPWLLNVSGTCPLCRIDLRPKEEQEQEPEPPSPVGGEASTSRQNSAAGPSVGSRPSMLDVDIAPPLGHLPIRLDRERRNSNAMTNRRDTTALANLRSVALGSREERIAALQRFRQQRRNQSSGTEQTEHEDDRRGLSTRLRERFRIRTRRQGEEEAQNESASAATRQLR